MQFHIRLFIVKFPNYFRSRISKIAIRSSGSAGFLPPFAAACVCCGCGCGCGCASGSSGAAASSAAGSSASSGSAASRTESSSTASSSKQETAGTANSGTEKPASSSSKQEAAYEKEVKALLQQLYSVKARAEAELNSCIAGAKAEFKSLPESQQTQARKVSIVLARSGRLYAMQASYDREVESIVSQMRAILTANGQSTALADQAMASYKAQKSAMYSRLTAKLYS